ncbi:GAF domain-containing protein (plasmid) [Halorussus salilacus]|uniref:GAF domain-containing protein n=1 Tax=Halorussus salilacus TaxID=2953750 RepID=UPI00209CFA38|nr:GAF domain-containing protein [Halorussus salilacus]USZ69765.1 GAF domain-containing protein [Halorussus salilacus]
MTETESTTIRVLHIDDDLEFAELVGLYLERERDVLDVTAVDSARDALDWLASEEFDCVVSDYEMPVTDGLELLDAVREEYPGLPFVLFTGKGSEEIASEAISAGVTDYLQKRSGTDQYAVLANRVVNAVESRRSERELAESRQRYQTLVEKSDDAIFVLRGVEFAFVNDRLSELTGYDRSELQGTNALDIVHPDDRERASDIAARRREGREVPDTYEVRLESKSGAVRHCELSVEPITYEGEYAVLGFARDVSDQKTYESTLEVLHDATRELMRAETKPEVCDIAVETARAELELPLTGGWLYDEASERLDPVATTDESESVVGDHPAFEPGESLAWRVYETGDPAVFDDVRDEEPVHNPDSDIRSEAILPLGEHGVLVSGATEVGAFDELDCDFLELLATNTETALERAEREATHRQLTSELRESKRKIEQLHGIATRIEACESAQSIYDLTVDAAERILEFDICIVDVEEDGLLETKSMSTGILAEETPTMSVEEGIAGRTYRTGESFRYDDIREVPEAKPQADYRSIISIPIGEYGVFQAVADGVGFFDERDVELAELLLSHTTEALRRVERERQLRESEANLRQQKERLEEFASIVSHDLRNPLNVAKGNLEYLLDDPAGEGSVPPDSDGRDRLAKAESALDRMDSIVQDVLALARQGQVVDDPETVRLDVQAERAWTNVATPDATLAVESQRRVEADPSRLQQLFENLFRNSIEHGDSNVTVRVLDLDATDPSAVGFAVEDDGPGISAADREDVFESEYSTAEDGTGFGLAIVDRIAAAHGWSVSVAEGRDGGARFEVRTGE